MLSNIILKVYFEVFFINVILLEIVFGLYNIGMVRGVMVIFLEYFFCLVLFSFIWVKCVCNILYLILKMMIFFIIWNLFVEILKKWNRNLFDNVKRINMINVMVYVFKVIYLCFFVFILLVICRNIGIILRGFIKVNSEVKYNVKYINIFMMIYSLLLIIIL